MANGGPVLLLMGLLHLATLEPQQPGWFWHFTDFHYDFTYWGDRLSQSMPVTSPGPFGDRWMDSSWELIAAALADTSTIKKEVDFLLWTGDNTAHIDEHHLNENIFIEVLRNITSEIDRNFPNTTTYGCLGNHDYFPVNLLPPTGFSAIYNQTADLWADWIRQPDQLDNFRRGGYYTLQTPWGLRVLVLNTNLYFKKDTLTASYPDPSGQFAWMEQVLDGARKAGQRVLLVAHIPPGIAGLIDTMWFQEEFNSRFLRILHEYSDVISALHHGHVHNDFFRVYYKDGVPAVPMFSAPSLSPWTWKTSTAVGDSHNPAIRLVKYNRTTGDTLEIRQYFLDLVRANAARATNWSVEYDFTEAYGVPNLMASSLHTVLQRMQSGENTLTENYYRYFTVNWPANQPSCGRECQGKIICGFQHSEWSPFNSCLAPYWTTAPPAGQASVLQPLVLCVTVGLTAIWYSA